MPDALQALIDVARLECRFEREVYSAHPDWTLPLDPTVSTWVVTLEQPVVLQRGECSWLLYPGCAALLRGGHDATIGTSITRNASPVDLDPDWPGVTGVLVGAATFGPLADEALALPAHLETQPPGAAVPSVVEAMRQVPALPQRWGRGQADTLAQLVVVTLLRHNPPPVLAADNSLGAVLDVLFGPSRRTCASRTSSPSPGCPSGRCGDGSSQRRTCRRRRSAGGTDHSGSVQPCRTAPMRRQSRVRTGTRRSLRCNAHSPTSGRRSGTERASD